MQMDAKIPIPKYFQALLCQSESFFRILIRIRHRPYPDRPLQAGQLFGESVGYIGPYFHYSPILPIGMKNLRRIAIDAAVLASPIWVESIIYAWKTGWRKGPFCFCYSVVTIPLGGVFEFDKISNSPRSSFVSNNPSGCRSSGSTYLF